MDSELTTSPPISANEEENLKLAAQIASVNLLFAQRELGKRLIDPTLSTKNLLDIAEHSYKTSGMAKKNDGKEDTGKVILNINFRTRDPVRIEKVINPEQVADTPATLAEAANALVSRTDVEFPDCPEFVSVDSEDWDG